MGAFKEMAGLDWLDPIPYCALPLTAGALPLKYMTDIQPFRAPDPAYDEIIAGKSGPR